MEWDKLLNAGRLGRRAQKGENGRTPFNSDHDKIIFSGAFRRLAKKTQVHPLATNDHIHNRLTHSLEAACVGRSLGIRVGQALKNEKRLPENILATDIGDIVQATCLAHDIGNPPFGHTGEEAIRHWFESDGKDYLKNLTKSEACDLENFEGNAQGLRVLTSSEYHPYDGGMRLTYATLASSIKYPWTSLRAVDSPRSKLSKYGVSQSELSTFTEIAEAVGLLKKGDDWYCRHPLVHLMEMADDFCYGIIDLEDGLEMGILKWGEIFEVLRPVLDSSDANKLEKEANRLGEGRRLPLLRGRVISAYVDAGVQAFMENEKEILNGKHDNIFIFLNETVRDSINNAKKMAAEKIFTHPRKIELEIGAYNTIGTVLDVMCKSVIAWVHDPSSLSFKSRRVIDLLGEDSFHPLLMDPQNCPRTPEYLAFTRVIDFISGMTDEYATYLAKQFNGMGGVR